MNVSREVISTAPPRRGTLEPASSRRRRPMPRLLTLITIAALVSLAPAAPIPTRLFPKEPPLYFPIQKGGTWVYDDGQAEEKLVVSAVEKTKEGVVVTVVNPSDGD